MSIVTVYDLLEVSENASKEEIEKSYQNLILEYQKNPKLSKEENDENELILNKLKLAYEILSNDEKRKKYDNDLAKKRAEELIKNVSVEKENTEIKNVSAEKVDTKIKKDLNIKEINNSTNKNHNGNIIPNVNNSISNYESNKKENIKEEIYEEDEEDEEKEYLNEEEKNKIKKAAKKEFKENLKKAKKAEEEYNKAYNEAYNNYLRKMGYDVKVPWTLKRIKNIIITILVLIIICLLIWIIPPTRNLLIEIYQENFIIKALVDIIVTLVKAIVNAFK